jgi:hypothetical protein
MQAHLHLLNKKFLSENSCLVVLNPSLYIYCLFPPRYCLNFYSCYTHCFLNPTGTKVQIGMQFSPSLHIQHLHWKGRCQSAEWNRQSRKAFESKAQTPVSKHIVYCWSLLSRCSKIRGMGNIKY